MEVDRVVPVTPEHVRLDEVREDQPLVDLAHQLLGLHDPVDVRLRRPRAVDVLAGEDVADLADAVYLVPRLADQREEVRPPRLEREVVPVRGPLVVAGLADEWASDHAADRMLPGQDLAGDPAAGVEPLEGDRLL